MQQKQLLELRKNKIKTQNQSETETLRLQENERKKNKLIKTKKNYIKSREVHLFCNTVCGALKLKLKNWNGNCTFCFTLLCFSASQCFGFLLISLFSLLALLTVYDIVRNILRKSSHSQKRQQTATHSFFIFNFHSLALCFDSTPIAHKTLALHMSMDWAGLHCTILYCTLVSILFDSTLSWSGMYCTVVS